MGFDIYYIILVIPAMIFSFWASVRVNSAFKKYSNVYSRSNMTGRQAAEAVLRQNGVAGVTVVPISGNLTDHYDPIRYAFRRKFIRALRARRSVSRLMRRGTPFSMRKVICR